MTEDLLKLAERVAAATGPDVALDMDVAEAVWGTVRPGYWPERRQRFASGDYPLDGPPAYTASLDVAMSLVPPDHFVELASHEGGWDATVGYLARSARAAEPALAVTAAALKARAVPRARAAALQGEG